MRWYRNGELYRLEQPVAKQYTFGKSPEFTSETEKLQAEIRFLRQQIDVLKSSKRGKGCGKRNRNKQIVRDYIEYYNKFRIQAKLKYQSPIEYRELAC